MSEVLSSDGHVTGVMTENGDTITTSKVVLAPGHSSRDLYKHLLDIGVEMRAKPFGTLSTAYARVLFANTFDSLANACRLWIYRYHSI